MRRTRPDGLRKYGGLGGTEPSPTIAELRLDANLTALFTAILERRPVGFTHGGRTRRVMPDRLAHIDGQWYLRCEDLDAAATRTFRLDRIAGAVLPHDDSPPVADSPAADSPAADGHGSGTTTGAVRFRPWEFGDGPAVEVSVALDGPAAAVALAEHPELEIVRQDGDQTIVTVSVRNRDGLWSWLLSFLDRAALLGPPEIIEEYLHHVGGLVDTPGGAR